MAIGDPRWLSPADATSAMPHTTPPPVVQSPPDPLMVKTRQEALQFLQDNYSNEDLQEQIADAKKVADFILYGVVLPPEDND